MKKTLVYNLWVNELITDSKVYEIHRLCLKYYRHVFDKMIFYLTVDDLNNTEIINNAMSWIADVCEGKIYEIKVRKNTYLCESETFREEILSNRDLHKDSFVFIAHAKGVNNLNKDLTINERHFYRIPESIIKWCIGAYFYSLNFIDEAEALLLGKFRSSEMFYGSFLTQLKNPEASPMYRLNKGNCHYSGTFYWININKFWEYKDNGIISLSQIFDRYWLEMLPGMIGGRKLYGDGCASHDDTAITEDFDLYQMHDDQWYELTNILGNPDEFWEFYNFIISELYKDENS